MITSEIQNLSRESTTEAVFRHKPNEFFILLLQNRDTSLCRPDREDVLWQPKGSILLMNYG